MNITTKKTVIFKSQIYGNEKEIEIHFGHNDIYWASSRGGDLDSFDELLLTFLPELNFEKFIPAIARSLERELYQILSNCQDQELTAAFFDFIANIELQFCETQKSIDGTAKKIMDHVIQLANKRIIAINDELKSNQKFTIIQKRMASII